MGRRRRPQHPLGINMQSKVAVFCCALAAAWLPPAAAQPQPLSNPADPQAAVPPAKYESAFAGYRPYREEKVAPWRDVNDDVARVGGHVGIVGGAGGHAAHGAAKPAASPPARKP